MATYSTEANALLDAFKEAAESKEFSGRKESRKRIRQHMRGNHWTSSEEQEDGARADPVTNPPVTNPSVQLTWLAVQRMHPKIFNGYSFEPEVVPEAGRQYESLDPDSELRQTIAKVAPPQQPGQPPQQSQETDSSKESKIKTALAQSLWEQSKGLEVVKEGSEGALWYGDWWFLDGWDDGKPFLDGFSSDKVRRDPDAKELLESRFVGYFVDRTLADLRATYPEHEENIGRALYSESSDETTPLPDEQINAVLECWFVKDDSLKTIVERQDVVKEQVNEFLEQGFEIVDEQTAKADPLFADGVAYHPELGIPIETYPPDGFTVTIGYTVEKRTQEPKYRGGWRFIKRVGKCVVFDGQNPSASGELPLHWLPCYRTPGELDARGVPDQVQDINKMIDILYADGMTYIRKAMPGLVSREGVLTEESAETLDIPGGPSVLTAYADEDTPINAVVVPYSFPELPAAFQNMIDRLVNMLSEITGSHDLQGANSGWDTLSGEAVEQIESAANARLTVFRNQIRNVCQGIVINMIANAEKYSDSPRALDVKIGGRTINMDIDARIFDVDDFERKFDVVIGSTDTLPQAGKARNEAILEAIGGLLELGPGAEELLDVLEVPEPETVKAFIANRFGQMQQNQAPGPVAIKQAENQSDVQKRFNESLSDGLEDFAKRKEVDPHSSLRALEYLQAGARGEDMPDIGDLLQETGGPQLPKPQAPQQQGGPPQGQMPPIPGGYQ